ncbi:hypothetical protein RclHR1_00670007 [Rhizophagus clarus]|nr:hypothetical protein RclHR1_00670007 [Rhizophagus clarus]
MQNYFGSDLFLKGINFYSKVITITPQYIPYFFNPETKDYSKNLSELHCNSIISLEFFYQLSQLYHNILLLGHIFEQDILNNNGLVDLIIVQKDLKSFIITQFSLRKINIFPLLISKLPNNTLNKINIRRNSLNSQIYKNLNYHYIIKIRCALPEWGIANQFLRNIGKNLKEFYLGDIYGNNDKYLNLAIVKFCPNLRKLSAGFKHDELETLKIVFNNRQYLESFNIWCGNEFLSEKETVEAIVKYSQNIYELLLRHSCFNQLDCIQKKWSPFLQFERIVYQKKPLSLVV